MLRTASDNMDEHEPNLCYVRPTTYKDAINIPFVAPQIVKPKQVDVDDIDDEEDYSDPFADYCDRSFLEFYLEFENYLQEHSLMMLGKSFEVMNIVYECIELIQHEEESVDESDPEACDEYNDLFDYY